MFVYLYPRLVLFYTEIINLLYCFKNKAREFRPLVYSCAEAMYELGTKLGNEEEVTDAEICRSVHFNVLFEPVPVKTNNLHMRNQRHRSASR